MAKKNKAKIPNVVKPAKHCGDKCPCRMHEEPEEGEMMSLTDLLGGNAEPPPPRATGIYGEVNNENSSNALVSMITLLSTGKKVDKETSETSYEPIEFYITTPGGSLYDMFSLYDMMTHVKSKGCDIETVGIGQVMSAGVLLLAAGTKGKRKVGRHCRLMMHDVKGEAYGLTRVLQESVDEIQVSKEDLIQAMLATTKLKEKQLRKIFAQGTDYFFGAEEAVQFGIADEIIG